MPITRRSLLGLLSSSTFFLTVGPTGVAAADTPVKLSPLDFPQGVASGDPQPHAVMLWTRAVPRSRLNEPVPLLLELATDSNFSTLLLQQQVHTDASSDYTVRAYVNGLLPDTQYYYRFLGAADSVSRSGRTRTAPAPDQARRVNLAFSSCQSYEQAYYGSWARMLEEDRAAAADDGIHFILHLGDFIYERCWEKRLDGGAQSRTVPPFPDGLETGKNRDAVSLADYRHLYKTYLSDPYLQEARARWPFICTWDDHEFADDNFQSFTTDNGQAVLEAQRKLSANQAWFEYIPAVLDEVQQQAHNFRAQVLGQEQATHNQTAVDSLRIYRQLRWGKNLDVILTDSRSYRTPACLPADFAASLGLPLNTVELVAIADAGKAYNDGKPPATLPFGDGTVANPAKDRAPGSMLGVQQRDWFLQTLTTSTAPWKLWANALPLLPLRLDMSSLPLTDYHDSIFNIDGWAGYPHEVAVVMRQVEDEAIAGVVSLSGDHHMHGAGTIRRSTTDSLASAVAVDFNVAGISSSPIFEDLYAVANADHPDFAALVYRQTTSGLEPVWNMSMLQGVVAAFTYARTGLDAAALLGPNAANPGLQYVDTTANGYGLASFDAGEVRVQLITMEDCRANFVQAPSIRHVAHFRLPLWRAGQEPQLEGPSFAGGAPFPFAPPTT